MTDRFSFRTCPLITAPFDHRIGVELRRLVLSSPGVASAAPPSPTAALALKPVQPDVDFEKVPPAVAEQCTVSDIQKKGWSGWEVLDPDGAVLRRFADTNDDKKVDLWCYFKYGVEVYRDVDKDSNGKADEYRWLGTGGIRWGLDDDEDGDDRSLETDLGRGGHRRSGRGPARRTIPTDSCGC